MSSEVHDDLSASLDALAGFIVGELTMRATLERVAQLGENAIPGADATGLTVLAGEAMTTAACTDPQARTVDNLQYERDDGPCLTAFRERQVVRVDAMEEEARWPEFGRAAAEAGIRSSLSAPLAIEDRVVGALNFYSRTPRAFTEADEDAATRYAGHAALVLANSEAYWRAHAVTEQLAAALQTRAVIEQAKGIIIAQSGVGEDEAFEILKRASQRENRKLRDIAHDMVQRAQERRRS